MELEKRTRQLLEHLQLMPGAVKLYQWQIAAIEDAMREAHDIGVDTVEGVVEAETNGGITFTRY